jgi:DNA polymerase-3 subunit alpha
LKRTGAVIHAPCINNSDYYTSIKETNVWMGYVHIQGLEIELCNKIIEERLKNGSYLHLQDFIERIAPGMEQLNILIRIGAFRSTGKNKKELLWEANFLQKKNINHPTTNLLFKEQPIEFKLPALEHHPLDDAIDEIELLGFPLCNVFELADDDVNSYTNADAIEQFLGKEVKVLGYLVTSKPVHTVKKETMYFHTFIDSNGDWLDTIFFPPTASRYNVQGKGFYSMKGKVVEEFGVFSVEVNYCKKIGIRNRADQANRLFSRDQSYKQMVVEREGADPKL